MKCWKLQNMAWTSNGPHMSQDRELVSLLITFISLALAKDARLVAPGAELAIYAQSRYSGRATYHRDRYQALLQLLTSRELVAGG